jgi:hypothetical protein
MAMNENGIYAFKYLQDKYKLSPAQAAGIVGNLMQESSMRTGALNPRDGNDGSDSIGIAQWNGTRATAMRKATESLDGGSSNLNNQLDHVMNEMQEKYPTVWKNLQNATDVSGATQAFLGFESPRGYTAKAPTNADGYKNRINYAGQALGLSPDQIASAQATSTPVPATNPNATTPTPPEEKKSIFPKILPDKIGKADTGDVLSKLGEMFKPAAAPQAPAPQLIQNSSNLQYNPNANITPVVSSGMFGSTPSAGGLSPDDKKKLMAMLGPRFGGLGGIV